MAANNKPIFFFKNPDLSECVLLIASIEKLPKTNPTQSRICRELIDKEPGLLLSPQPPWGGFNIHVILKKTLYNVTKTQRMFKKLSLWVYADQGQISMSEYQSCLTYTVVAKLAPLWNVVGAFLVEGKDFMTNPHPTNAITGLEIVVNNSESHVTFQPLSLQLTPIRKEHIHINSYVYIMPKLTQVVVDSVTSVLPIWGEFNNYDVIKDHWKNSYGYDLPESPGSDMFYVNTHFSSNPRKIYNYPKFSVLPHLPTIVPRINPEPIVRSFASGFLEQIVQICGEIVEFIDKKPAFATTTFSNLLPSSDLSQSGLTRNAPSTTQPLKSSLNPNAFEFKPSTLLGNIPIKRELNIDELPDLEAEQQVPEKKFKPVFNHIKKEIKPEIASKTVLAEKPLNIPKPSTVKVEVNSGKTGGNIDRMRSTNDLDKWQDVTCADLRDFLKQNDIPFKVKDKKGILITAVKKYLENNP